jgi:hypothetical protein
MVAVGVPVGSGSVAVGVAGMGAATCTQPTSPINVKKTAANNRVIPPWKAWETKDLITFRIQVM